MSLSKGWTERGSILESNVEYFLPVSEQLDKGRWPCLEVTLFRVLHVRTEDTAV